MRNVLLKLLLRLVNSNNANQRFQAPIWSSAAFRIAPIPDPYSDEIILAGPQVTDAKKIFLDERNYFKEEKRIL